MLPIKGISVLVRCNDSSHVMHAIMPENAQVYRDAAVPTCCFSARMPALLVKGAINPSPKQPMIISVMFSHGVVVC